MHRFFHVFSYTFNSYDTIVPLGVLAGIFYLYLTLSKIQYIRKRDLILFLLIMFVVQQVGGTVLPYVWQFTRRGTLLHLVDQVTPGRYFHSVFISTLVYVIFACRQLKWPLRKVLDKFVIAVILASAIGRIGCFMQGCCKGKPTALPWCVHFPAHPLECLHPTQLYMLGIETVLFLVLLHVDKHKKYDSFTFWTGVLLYSIYRFFIEFVRINPVFVLGLTHAQVFSIFTFALSSLVLLKKSKEMTK